MTVEEVQTKFTADISAYRKKMAEMTKALKSIGGVTDQVKEVTQKAMQSNSAQIQKAGKELGSLIKTQNKHEQAAINSGKRIMEYKEKVKFLMQQLKEQEAETRKLTEVFDKLNTQYEEQKSFLSNYDGGIEGVRKLREELTKTLQQAAAVGGSAKESLAAEMSKLEPSTAAIALYNRLFSEQKEIYTNAKAELSALDDMLAKFNIDINNTKSDPLKTLQSELQNTARNMRLSEEAQARLTAQVKTSEGALYAEDQNYASLVNSLRSTESEMNSLQQKIRSVSKVNAAEKLKKGFSGLKSTVSKVGGVIAKPFQKLHGLISKVRGATSGTNKSLLNVAKSIKRIGVVSLGLKLVRGIFGKLRSVVSDYLSKNEKLNARVEALKNAFANALAPAIQVVVGLFEKLMPYALSVANAISDLMSSIGISKSIQATAGAISDTTKETEKLSKVQSDLYGFDQITKVGDDQSDSSSSSSSSGLNASSQLNEYLNQIKELWKSGDFEGVGSQIASSLNSIIGKINGLDWNGIQTKVNNAVSGIARAFNGFVHDFDWNGAGQIVGKGINTITGALDTFFTTFDFKGLGTGIADWFNGLLTETDWGKIGKTLGDYIKGVFDLAIGFIQEFDWSGAAHAVIDFFKGIDWSGITSKLFEGLGSALGGLASFLGTFINEAFENVKDYFDQYTLGKTGKDLVEGIFNGIWEWMKSVGRWVRDNIGKPLVEGFKKTFDIHSPAKAKEIVELGSNLIEGVFNGIVDWLKNIGTWLKTNVFDVITKAWGDFKDLSINVVVDAKEKVKNRLSTLKKGIDNIKDKTAEVKAKVLQKASDKAKLTVDNLKDKISNIKSKTAEVKAKVLQKASDKATLTVDGLKEKISKIKDTTAQISVSIKDTATKAINGLIEGLNKAITKLKSIKIAGVQPFKGLETIPKLATGGVLKRGQVGFLEGNGDEAVVPLEKNTGWISKLAAQIVSLSGQQSGGNPTRLVIPIYIGAHYLTDIVIDDLNKDIKSTNNIPLRV